MMMIDRFRILAVVAAIFSVGFVAAVFVHWSETIGPALAAMDDRTFVAAEQQLDSAIFAPLFMGFGFGGAFLFLGLAALLQIGAGRPSAIGPILIALGLHLVTAVITIAINEPLNLVIRSAGDPATADVSQVRAAFDESTWLIANHLRAAAEVIGFVLLLWALIRLARSSERRSRPVAQTQPTATFGSGG